MNTITAYLERRASNLKMEVWAAIHEAVQERNERDGIKPHSKIIDDVTCHDFPFFPDVCFQYRGEIVVTVDNGQVHKQPMPVHGCATPEQAISADYLVSFMMERTRALSAALESDPR